MKNKTTFEKLAEKIYEDTGVKLTGFHTLHTSIIQKEAGKWSWGAYDENNSDVGSTFSAS
jgi:hypothetical protein